jgi:NAD+ kinase
MIEKILVVYSEKETSGHNACLNELKEVIPEAKFIHVSDLDSEDLAVDLVISVGGDGTFIRVSHFLDEQYILGINSEPSSSEGALCSIDCTELKKIRKVISGAFEVKKRNRVQVRINGELIEKKALNEIYFGSRNQFHTSRYVVLVGERVEEQRSSGLLVVTSTGSGAWYKSAGGEDFGGEGLRYIVREPYVSRVFDSKLLGGKISGEMKIISKMHYDAVVSIDSNSIHPIKFNDEVIICSSSNFLNVVELK